MGAGVALVLLALYGATAAREQFDVRVAIDGSVVQRVLNNQAVRLEDYMRLPVSAYAMLPMPAKASLARVPGTANEFELCVPPLKFIFVEMEPRVRATVESYKDKVVITSDQCVISGSDMIHKLRLNDKFRFQVQTVFTWDEHGGHIRSDSKVIVEAEAVGPFSFMPRPILEATGCQVMRLAVDMIQGAFLKALGADWERFATDAAYRATRLMQANECAGPCTEPECAVVSSQGGPGKRCQEVKQQMGGEAQGEEGVAPRVERGTRRSLGGALDIAAAGEAAWQASDHPSKHPSQLLASPNREGRWHEDVRERLECWYVGLPLPTQAQLGGCLSALLLHMGSRLDGVIGTSRGGGTSRGVRGPGVASSEPGCEWLDEEIVNELQIPDFPTPDFEFTLPPIPRLLPRWRTIFESLIGRGELAAWLAASSENDGGGTASLSAWESSLEAPSSGRDPTPSSHSLVSALGAGFAAGAAVAGGVTLVFCLARRRRIDGARSAAATIKV
jgi:hypothetical protein